MMKLDNKKFEEVKKEAKEYYDSINRVKNSYLGEDVNFNSEGFEHLIMKSWNRSRSIKEQYIRLRLVSKAVDIIKKSHTLQEYDERNMFIRRKINSKWQQEMKLVRYYVFIALLLESQTRFKVVVKQIEGGQPFFWTIYPSWLVNKDIEGNKKKVFFFGNLEED